jgi:cell division protein FtsL
VLTAALLIAPVVAAGLFYVWTRVATLRLGYELSKAGEAHQALIEQNRGLRIEAASLKAPDRLARLAHDKYRLEPPRASQVIKLEPRPAEGAQGAVAP